MKERTSYNMELASYEKISFEKGEEGINIVLGDREYFIHKEAAQLLGKNAFYAVMGDTFTYLGEFFEKNVN